MVSTVAPRLKQSVIHKPLISAPALVAAVPRIGSLEPGESVVGSSSDVSFTLPPTLYVADSSVSSTQNDHQAEPNCLESSSSHAISNNTAPYNSVVRRSGLASPSSSLEHNSENSGSSVRGHNDSNVATAVLNRSVGIHCVRVDHVGNVSKRDEVRQVESAGLPASVNDSQTTRPVSPRGKVISPRGLVDSLSQFFTPSDKRKSRVSLNALPSAVPIESAVMHLALSVAPHAHDSTRLSGDVANDLRVMQKTDLKMTEKTNKRRTQSTSSQENDYYTPKLTSKRIKLNDGNVKEKGAFQTDASSVNDRSATTDDVRLATILETKAKNVDERKGKVASAKHGAAMRANDCETMRVRAKSVSSHHRSTSREFMDSGEMASGDNRINLQESTRTRKESERDSKNNSRHDGSVEMADMSQDVDPSYSKDGKMNERDRSACMNTSAARKRKSTQLDSLNDSLSHLFTAESTERRRTQSKDSIMSSVYSALSRRMVSRKQKVMYSKYTASTGYDFSEQRSSVASADLDQNADTTMGRNQESKKKGANVLNYSSDSESSLDENEENVFSANALSRSRHLQGQSDTSTSQSEAWPQRERILSGQKAKGKFTNFAFQQSLFTSNVNIKMVTKKSNLKFRFSENLFVSSVI